MGAALLAFSGLACGRSLPEDEPVATGPVETGAFDLGKPEDVGDAAITGIGSGIARDYVVAVGKRFRAEDPAATLEIRDGEPDFEALCAGEIDLAAGGGDADEDVCGGTDAVVGFHLANAGGDPIVIYVNRESIMRLEVEGLIQHAVAGGETLPQLVGAEPLPPEELRETQTKLEQVTAGVA